MYKCTGKCPDVELHKGSGTWCKATAHTCVLAHTHMCILQKLGWRAAFLGSTAKSGGMK